MSGRQLKGRNQGTPQGQLDAEDDEAYSIQSGSQLARFGRVRYIYARGARPCRIPPLAEKGLVMSQDTDSVLSQISEAIDAKELEQARAANQRVGTAYGSESRGLIVVVQVSAPAKPEDQF